MEQPLKRIKIYFNDHPMAAWWAYDLNFPVVPSDVTRSSGKKFFFYHSACGHTYNMALHDIKQDHPYCPYCMSSVAFCGDKSCVHCYNRSFASFDLKTIIWHPTLNVLKPWMISKGSKKKFYFYHDVCKHTFEKRLNDITCIKPETQQCGCPYCLPTSHMLCGDITCDRCYKRSLAAVVLNALTWDNSKNGNIYPHMIAPHTKKKYYFKCNNCNHDTLVIVAAAIVSVGCQYCKSGKHCGDINCELCKNNSILSLEMSKYLSPKNEPNVWMLSKGSKSFAIFDCPHCKLEYRAPVIDVSHGHWCGCKKNKTEAKLYQFLITTFPNKHIEKNATFEWCRSNNTNYLLRFDFCIDRHTICELDGGHHFQDIPHWNSNVTERQQQDLYKIACAHQNGYRVIRIYQRDVWDDKNNWSVELVKLINDCTLQLSFVPTNNELAMATYAMYAEKCKTK